ncbi:hypothetical protein [Helicobacter trogontum]|uniref:hypothetical protein n=1 Tax=Helicobacter trogontum TaxID=50960 RepID=UPI000B2478AA|nr:hypothetical protein [Helicobacter trogontum]
MRDIGTHAKQSQSFKLTKPQITQNISQTKLQRKNDSIIYPKTHTYAPSRSYFK